MFDLRRFLAIAAALAVHSAAAADAVTLTATQLDGLGIRTAVAGEGPAANAGLLPAKVLVPVDQMRIIAAPMGGRVESLAVAEGMSVSAGQAVATLSSPDMLQLQREAMQASSEASLAQSAYVRDQKLFEEGLIPESRLQASRAAAAQAGALSRERSQVLTLSGASRATGAGKSGGALVLSSPIDGVVLEKMVDVGERVDASAAVFRVARLSPLWLEIQVPLAVADRLANGAPVDVAAAGVQGKVIAVGRAVDPATQTVMVRAEVSEKAEALRPGQMVSATIGNTSGVGVSVPSTALVREGGRTLVFVRGNEGEAGVPFDAKPVEVLEISGAVASVRGVEAGQTIAVSGVSGLKAMMTGVGAE